MRVYEETVTGACGISVLYEFGYGKEVSDILIGGGIGLVCAGFIDGNETSDKVFNEMQKRGQLLFKSPVRKNRNSGNMFYFAVFDWSAEGTAEYGFDDAEAHDDDDDEGDF